MRKYILAFFVCLFFLLVPFAQTRADSVDDQISQVKKDLDALTSSLKNKESDQQKLNTQLANIKSQLVFLDAEIKKKEKEVEVGEGALSYQTTLLQERARAYYKNAGTASMSLIDFLVAENLSTSLEDFFYKRAVVDQDKNTIVRIVLYIKDLEKKKVELQTENKQLAALRVSVDEQTKLIAQDIVSTRQKIAELSSQQQRLVAQKQASLNLPVSAGSAATACVDDRERDPGFSPRFAFFTYGVPNRVGLNQYGAYGRSKAGQNYETILRAYYNFDEMKDVDVNININVEGHGAFTLEEYVKRVYEVPSSWGDAGGMDALRAQAVAARSYVMAYTNSGAGSICTTEYCQVFKPEPKGGNWETAVNDTKGKVLYHGGSPVKAWFSSTHGGYVFSSGEIGWSGTGWTKHATDTTTGSAGSFGDLQANAYDKDSPWFYCDWGARGDTKTAWLRPNEVADIVNVILLAKADSGAGEHLYQPDKSNPAGTDTWDAERVKRELKNKGGNSFSSISDVSVSADFGGGRSTNLTFSGDAGSVNLSASEFKDWFNLRAPANIQIVGTLFNVEKR